MTISATARRAGPFLGNGAATSFAFTFKVFSSADIAVSVANSAGVETLLVLDADYTVTLNANQDTSPGGTVTYPISGVPLPVGSTLVIVGDIDFNQPLDLPAGGNFSPLALENQLDRTVMQIQELDERLGRALLLPVNSSFTVALPTPAAGELLGWDQSETSIINYTFEDIVSAAMFTSWVYDTFTGTGAQTVFTLQRSPGSIANCDVSVDGVTLVPLTDFSLSGATLTFITAPGNGTEILVRYGDAAAQRTYAVETERKLATAGQTVVTLTQVTYVPGGNHIAVYLNGVRLSAGIDFTETSSTSITLTDALALNDEVVCVVGSELTASVASENVGFLQAGAGAVSRDVRSKLREQLVSVKDFGAVGDGIANDTAAIQAAFNAISDREIFFPAGTYLCGAVTIPNQCRVVGEGADATYIKASGAAIDVWTVTTTARVDVENLTFSPAVESVSQTAGAYLKYDPASSFNFGSRIRNCIFVRAYRGVQFIDAAGWSIEDCYFPLYTFAVEVQNIDTPDAGDSTIRACVFDAAGATGTAIRQLSSGGLRIVNNKILNGDRGYYGVYDSSPSSTSILLIQNNSIESQATAGIALNSTSSTSFSMVVIEGNQFSVAASGVGLTLMDPGYDYLDSVNISDNLFNLGTFSKGVNFARGARITLLPNTFYGNSTNETAVTIGANVDSAVLYPQVVLDCTTDFTGVFTNVTFYAGLSLSGTVSTTTGSAYSSMYISAEQTVTFASAFPVAPKVQATLNSTAGGGVSVAVYSVTTTDFKMKIIGLTNGGSVSANWFATL
jgi:hypothetical protein